MTFEITINNTQNKSKLLAHFRELGNEKLAEIRREIGNKYPKKIASHINKAINKTKHDFLHTIIENADCNNWNDQDKISSLLFTTYCAHVVMLDLRHEVRPYDYMDFSRRIGELWEDFVRLPFLYPPKTAELASFVPPLFSEVRKNLKSEIKKYIDTLPISEAQRNELINYYEKVWLLVDSGEISLELDFHAIIKGKKFNIDFKSGFGSNEKGNTNRLLMVATIYRNLEDEYNNVLLVRAKEYLNNNYFRILKNSDVWDAYCGDEAYQKIGDFTGFDIQNWINLNIDWQNDLLVKTVSDFQQSNLMGYLQWQ
ncbi:hypothetical protein H6F47_06120 [Sphaerospermopsis sp. FACHB-1094]|uniref:hypothetical protein n=1 Tax=Sphaerospermopsis sp. FACHB-1094 TaxID=2692861 RepID=UPI0016878823|nr:hypothetical protein [Sphaerospermopsis sp. FACHB-1094]MBD2132037.1 hypothetical protein [Sphaerospermopsis sp. FACHB-1094]